MYNTLKAWKQKPDDYRLNMIFYPNDWHTKKDLRPRLWNQISAFFWNAVNKPIGLFIFIIVLCSIGASLAGMS